jgi:3-hydroxy acid dehydrogenase/malonic semialdehyde reductase
MADTAKGKGRGTALVTGGSRGIGRAITLRLARDGYDVIAVARKQGELDAVCDEVGKAGGGGKCRSIALDVSDGPIVAAALKGLDVDVLVNNAGIGIMKPFVDLAPDEWKSMIDVNVNALYHVTRAVLPSMMARGRGHVCTIGSIAGRSAFIGGSCYNATKAFVTSWAESLMLEVRESGVKVSVVMPGAVATQFGGKAPSAADSWKLTPDDVADTVAHVLATPPNVLLHRVEVRTLKSPPPKGQAR